MNKEIVNLLSNLGVPMHLKGYKYLVMAIELCQQNQDIRMSKELYVTIGRKYNDTPSRVERSMRHAIEVAWTRSCINYELINSVFGNSIDVNKANPTNAQFCKSVANYLKYDLGSVKNEKI